MTKEEFQKLEAGDLIWFPHGGLEGVLPGIVDEIVKEYVIVETPVEGLYSIHREDAFLTKEEALKEKEKQDND